MALDKKITVFGDQSNYCCDISVYPQIDTDTRSPSRSVADENVDIMRYEVTLAE